MRVCQRDVTRARSSDSLCARSRAVSCLVALGEQARDVVLRVENALALDFRRMRGEDGDDQRVVEEFLQERLRLRVLPLRLHLLDGVGDRAGLRRGTGERVDAAAAVVMPILGDVREMRKIAECAHDAHGLFGRQLAQALFERLRCLAIVLAAEFDGRLTNRLDDVVHGVAFLLAQHFAEEAAEEADVFEKRAVLVLAGAAGPALRCFRGRCVDAVRFGFDRLGLDRGRRFRRLGNGRGTRDDRGR